MNIVLAPLMGLPSCGKSTLCSEMLKQNYEFKLPTELLVFSYDDFVPIVIQSKYSTNVEESGSDKLSVAKSLRCRFLRIIEFLVFNLKKIEPSLYNSLSCSSVINELENILNLEFPLEFPINESSESTSLSLSLEESFGSKFYHLIKSIDFQAYKNLVIVIDDNNYYHSMRNEIYQIAKKFKTGFCIFYPIASIEECLERNGQREEIHRVPDSVISSMRKKLEEPNPLRNTCDIFCIQISNVKDERIHSEILNTLESAIANPIDVQIEDRTDEIARERRICAENEIHQADQILRRWIHTETIAFKFSSSTTSTNPGSNESLKSLSQKLLGKKNKVIDGLKTGKLTVQTQLCDYVGFQKEIIKFAELAENDM